MVNEEISTVPSATNFYLSVQHGRDRDISFFRCGQWNKKATISESIKTIFTFSEEEMRNQDIFLVRLYWLKQNYT